MIFIETYHVNLKFFISDLAHLEREFSKFSLATTLRHVEYLEEDILASVFPLEGNHFVYNIEN
jgi:hypothetical protein